MKLMIMGKTAINSGMETGPDPRQSLKSGEL
jgi:hypothetical protein